MFEKIKGITTRIYVVKFNLKFKLKKFIKRILIQESNLDQDIRNILLYHWANENFFILNAVGYYCSCNHDKNFSSDIDSMTIGIELCKIPHISEHCPKNEPSLFTSTDIWLSLPG